jgi:hypothetical protein
MIRPFSSTLTRVSAGTGSIPMLVSGRVRV